VSQPDTVPTLENNYCLQIIETGFGGPQRMGPATICLKSSATYRMIPLSTRLFSHWSIPLINYGVCRSDIEEAARRCRRNPGEPRLTLELTLTGKTTKEATLVWAVIKKCRTCKSAKKDLLHSVHDLTALSGLKALETSVYWPAYFR
jgi:hypothetical protein